jgi:hypothetical protein
MGLEVEYTTLFEEIGFYLGYGRDVPSVPAEFADESKTVLAVLNSGLRQFYYPPPIGDPPKRHVWSFLSPKATIVLDLPWEYDLPADYGGVITDLVWEKATGSGISQALSTIGVEQLMSIKAKGGSSVIGPPQYVAIRATTFDATATPRYQLLVYPEPGTTAPDAGTIHFRYNADPGPLTDTDVYPLGGAGHAETLIASCLSAAERKLHDEAGVQHNRFMELLAASVALDQEQRMAAEKLSSSWPTTDADTALELSYDSLCREVGGFLGYGYNPAAWDHMKTGQVDSLVQKGLRRFYYPPPLPNQGKAHRWTFLQRDDVLRPKAGTYVPLARTGITYDSGTGKSTILITAGESWDKITTIAYTNGYAYFVASDNYYVIAEIKSAPPRLLVTGDASAELDNTVRAYPRTASRGRTIPLPAEYGGIVGNRITWHEPAGITTSMPIVNEGQIRGMYQRSSSTGQPAYAAIRPQASDGENEQGRELYVWPPFADSPVFETTYEFGINYLVRPPRLTSDNPYPLGGAEHSETILSACLSMAEEVKAPGQRTQWERFLERLAASVSQDRESHQATYLGYMADTSDDQPSHRRDRTMSVTQAGVLWD